MHLSRRNLLQMATAMGAATLLGGRFAAAQGTQTLRIGLSTYPPHFRPWVNIGWSGHLLFSLVNRNLINYDDQGNLVGELVESWSAVEDDAWEFKLRDVKFHDGSPVTSADVKWNFEEIAKEQSGAYMYDALKVVKDVEIVDDRTFRLRTDGPVATIPALMAFPFFTILKAGSTDVEPQGIGAGPYKIVYAEKGVGIELEPSEHYFKGQPPLAGISVTAYADESARVAAVTAGDVDLVDYVPWSAMAAIDANPALKLFKKDAGPFMYLSFNGSGPFADARLRQAVAFGLRREEFVKSVFFGFGAPMTGLPRASGTAFHNEDQAKFWGYDPERSKALMKEAGHENGFEVTLLATSQYSMHRDTAVLIQSQLAEIGIKVNLVLPDWATRITMGNNGIGDFAVQGNALDIIDPDATHSIVDPSLTPTYLRSRNFEIEGLTELYQAGRSELDDEKRVEIYRRADQLVLDNTAICGVAYRAQGYATSASVQKLPLLPDQISVYSATNFDQISLG